jgi:hypothetical protein
MDGGSENGGEDLPNTLEWTPKLRQQVKGTNTLNGCSKAVTTLLKIMVDPAAPMAVKARCAYYILDQTKKAIETEEIEARVTELERTAATQKQGSWR